MTDINVKQELLDATSEMDIADSESRNEFKFRLLRAVDELSDSQFDSLSESAQNWIISAIRQVNDSEVVSIETIPFPPFPEESRKEREQDMTIADNPDTGRRMQQRRKPATERKGKQGVNSEMEELILMNPDITWPKLQSEMKKLGYEVSKQSCQVKLSTLRRIIQKLRELNMLKE